MLEGISLLGSSPGGMRKETLFLCSMVSGFVFLAAVLFLLCGALFWFLTLSLRLRLCVFAPQSLFIMFRGRFCTG